jgi:hypothetical protein
VAWSLGLFGLLRLNWTEARAVLPFTRMQSAAAGLRRHGYLLATVVMKRERCQTESTLRLGVEHVCDRLRRLSGA